MLTNTVIKVTFGDLRAQQISAIIFQCGLLYHTEDDFIGLFIHLRTRKNFFKYAALFYPLRNIIWTKTFCRQIFPVRYVSLCILYFICQKSSHRFLPIFFLSYWGYCSHWIYKIKSGVHRALISLLRLVLSKSLTFYTHRYADVLALMTQKFMDIDCLDIICTNSNGLRIFWVTFVWFLIIAFSS